ncbi:MAG: glycosyltransferase [Anaerolineae bacterium]
MSSQHPPVGTTFHYGDNAQWETRVHVLKLPYIPPDPSHTLVDELRWLVEVVVSARRESVLLLNCSSGKLYPDLIASMLFGMLPARWRPVVILAGAMYNPNHGLRHVIERLVLQLADRGIHRYAVWSSEELEEMPRVWGIAPKKLRRCNYFYTFTEADIAPPEPPIEGHIFAGGNSQRDYEPLVEAARRMPDQQFIIATNRLKNRTDLPLNLSVRDVPHSEFVRLMRTAAAVIIPMKRGMSRSAGQQSYLNAMLLGKPVIVSESFGVRDLIEHGKTGFIVSGTPESYVEILRTVLDPAQADAMREIGQTARAITKGQFSYDQHLRMLLEVIDEAVDDPDVRAHSRLHAQPTEQPVAVIR